VDELAHRMLFLLERPALCARLGERCRVEAAAQRWEDRAGELAELYAQIA
jgi:glycosyltransferase involved in cell wall biosynthesis